MKPYLLVALMAFIHLAQAADNRDQKYGVESYVERPNILSLNSKLAPSDIEWENIKLAQLNLIAQMIELYPNEEIYFLARDAEYIYDLANVLLQEDPVTLRRIHLLNISRENVKAPSKIEYLKQNGISASRLKNKQILFVDTGYNGSIPKQIASLFPANLSQKISTHLIVSSSSLFPSSRVFLQQINRLAYRLIPNSLHGTIVKYEHLPRYTNRSNDFRKITQDGPWEAISTKSDADGRVDRIKAVDMMQDLKHYGEQESTRNLFQKLRQTWLDLYALGMTNSREHIREDLISSLQKGNISQAEAADFIDYLNKRRMNPISLTEQDIGLKAVLTGTGGYSNLEVVFEAYPEWEKLFDNLEFNLASMFTNGTLSELNLMVDNIYDTQFEKTLVRVLDQNPNQTKVNAVLDLLSKKPLYLTQLIENFYNAPKNIDLFRTQYLKILIAAIASEVDYLIPNLMINRLPLDRFSTSEFEEWIPLIFNLSAKFKKFQLILTLLKKIEAYPLLLENVKIRQIFNSAVNDVKDEYWQGQILKILHDYALTTSGACQKALNK